MNHQPEPPEWLDDPEYFVFAGEQPLPPGASQQHAIGEAFGKMFPREREQVRRDWQRSVEQIRSLLERMPLQAGQYALEDVTFELGFSAEGKIVFVAQAGITTTISVTFKRQEAAPESPAGGPAPR